MKTVHYRIKKNYEEDEVSFLPGITTDLTTGVNFNQLKKHIYKLVICDSRMLTSKHHYGILTQNYQEVSYGDRTF